MFAVFSHMVIFDEKNTFAHYGEVVHAKDIELSNDFDILIENR